MQTNSPSNAPDFFPRITVIVPCRNEANFIAQCVESIISNDYPWDCVEILVMDGMSDDGSWLIIRRLARRFPIVKPMRNKEKTAATALNLGIKNATGEIICRVDAHAWLAPDYLRQCLRAMSESGADNVGGAMETMPSRGTSVARAIAAAMSHPFGVGNSIFALTLHSLSLRTQCWRLLSTRSVRADWAVQREASANPRHGIQSETSPGGRQNFPRPGD